MNTPILHPFDAAVALEPLGGGRFLGRTSADYWNMVGPYGGITAAVMLRAMLLHPERKGSPLAFTLSYVAPVEEGEFVVEARLVRANRSNQHWAVAILQGSPERVVAQAIAICALRRETWGCVEVHRPDVPSPEACERMTPRRPTGFLQRYEFRHVRGTPFRDNEDTLSHTWVADLPARPLDFPSLTAICDSFMPRIFLRRTEWVPIATVSMNIYFHAGEEAVAAHGTPPLLTVAQGQAFRDGHFDHQGQVWGRGDTLLATTHQIVWYKE